MRFVLGVLLSLFLVAGWAHFRVISHMSNKPVAPAYERLSQVAEKVGDGPLSEHESQELIAAAKEAQSTPQGLIATLILLREYQATGSAVEYSEVLENGLANLYGADLYAFLGIAGQQGQEMLQDSLLSDSAREALFACMRSASESFFAASPELGYWIDAYSETFGFPRMSCER